MSYCRFMDADVYVFLNVSGYLECCACPLHAEPWGSVHCDTTAAMLTHLDEHVAAGHHVPDYAFERLRDDAVENDEWIAKKKEERDAAA